MIFLASFFYVFLVLSIFLSYQFTMTAREQVLESMFVRLMKEHVCLEERFRELVQRFRDLQDRVPVASVSKPRSSKRKASTPPSDPPPIRPLVTKRSKASTPPPTPPPACPLAPKRSTVDDIISAASEVDAALDYMIENPDLH